MLLIVVLSGKKTELFPIAREAVKVWEWPQVKEISPPGEPYNFFVVRYHQAPAGSEELGPYGFSVYLRDVPELGVVFAVWNIKKDSNGNYDFQSAIFAHCLENDFWFVPGKIRH